MRILRPTDRQSAARRLLDERGDRPPVTELRQGPFGDKSGASSGEEDAAEIYLLEGEVCCRLGTSPRGAESDYLEAWRRGGNRV